MTRRRGHGAGAAQRVARLVANLRYAPFQQSFEISAARRLNKLLGRRGRVFSDRYHMVVVRSPRHMRAVLAFVPGNWRRHGADRRMPAMWSIDPYSSAHVFDGWCESWMTLWPPDDDHVWPIVTPARSWLARAGWRQGGPPLNVFERPGPRPD